MIRGYRRTKIRSFKKKKKTKSQGRTFEDFRSAEVEPQIGPRANEDLPAGLTDILSTPSAPVLWEKKQHHTLVLVSLGNSAVSQRRVPNTAVVCFRRLNTVMRVGI